MFPAEILSSEVAIDVILIKYASLSFCVTFLGRYIFKDAVEFYCSVAMDYYKLRRKGAHEKPHSKGKVAR